MLTQIRDKKLLWPAVMTLIGVALLIGLGNWQMRRLAWKQGLIGAIAERTHVDPVPLATVEARAAEGGDPEYARVTVAGQLLNDHELYFYDFDESLGPGYHVVTPLKRADGSVVFVNRGFVPDDRKDPTTRAARRALRRRQDRRPRPRPAAARHLHARQRCGQEHLVLVRPARHDGGGTRFRQDPSRALHRGRGGRSGPSRRSAQGRHHPA